MVEFWLLAKVGMIVQTAVNAGYLLAGGYAIRTGYTYVQDYRDSVARERELK